MKKADYYIEFYEVVDNIINEYLTLHDLPSYVGTVLFENSYSLKARYNRARAEGMDIADATVMAAKSIIPEYTIVRESIMPDTIISLRHIFDKLGDRLAIYVYNSRQLRYLRPFLDAVNRPLVLLCEESVNLDMELPEYVEAVDLDYSITENMVEVGNTISDRLTRCYILLNSILTELAPEGVILLEGCHFQEQMIGEIAHSLDIPSILLQQGWPSLMHTMFRRFPYSHFLTWGDNFNSLWHKYNPKPQYSAVGYPYAVKKKRGQAIAFFLQAPLFISDESYYSMLVNLIAKTAHQYNDHVIIVREHPEFRMQPAKKAELVSIPNVQFATNWPLADVFANSKIVVSHFSSSLIEGVAHGCIPLVFDPTSDSDYHPDIEMLGLGCIAKAENQFIGKLEQILSEEQTYVNNLNTAKRSWFQATDHEAEVNQAKEVNVIAPLRIHSHNPDKLNLGCGRNVMNGWLNVDLFSMSPKILTMDASKPYPFPDESFDYIYSEHMFEHLDLAGQQNMMRECYRVLRPGGVLRLAMPNFDFLVDLVNNPNSEINNRYLDWSYQLFIQHKLEYEVDREDYPIYVVNNFMRDWGHQFIHTTGSLANLGLSYGFNKAEQCHIGKSRYYDLIGCERHQNEIPVWANDLETFVMEFSKAHNYR